MYYIFDVQGIDIHIIYLLDTAFHLKRAVMHDQAHALNFYYQLKISRNMLTVITLSAESFISMLGGELQDKNSICLIKVTSILS